MKPFNFCLFIDYILKRNSWLRSQVLADILPRDTLLWKLQMMKSASSFANSRLHAVKAQILILARWSFLSFFLFIWEDSQSFFSDSLIGNISFALFCSFRFPFWFSSFYFYGILVERIPYYPAWRRLKGFVELYQNRRFACWKALVKCQSVRSVNSRILVIYSSL